jgi:hypothetical protein
MSEQTLPTTGRVRHLEARRQGWPGSGPPVVLLHGYPQTHMGVSHE